MNRIVRLYCWACMERTRYVLAVGLGAFGTGLALVLVAWFALTGRFSGEAVETAFVLAWIVGTVFGLGMWYAFGRRLKKTIEDAVRDRDASAGSGH